MFKAQEGIIKPIVYVGIVNQKRLLLVDYIQAPNSAKSGWWIPAPGLEFGEDPKEKAQKVCAEFEISIDEINLKDVESFVLPGGWHLICHYIVTTSSEPKSHPNVKNYCWVTVDQLSQMTDIAHGKWEIGVGTSFLT